MKSPAIRRNNLPAGQQHERGVTLILVALSMIGVLAMAALSIDVITLYLARLEAQRSADAAALTAAKIIAISGITGDPTNASGYWASICGATGIATKAAQAVGGQNAIGSLASTVTVKYATVPDGADSDCSTRGAAFGVNPMVTVQVQRTGLPSFFARMWRAPSQTVSATATAEAFNPSNSQTFSPSSSIIPVQPRCVKPLIVPNRDPWNAAGSACVGTGCTNFVGSTNSSIQRQGISLAPLGTAGVIGETFKLLADCGPGPTCGLVTNPPAANVSGGGFLPGPAPPPPNLEYLPGAVPSNSIAAPACGDDSAFQKAVAGCDQTTDYKCGVAGGNTLDLTNNPAGPAGDTSKAAQCLIHQASPGFAPADADSLNTAAFPFKINAGTSNPTGLSGSLVTTSDSIVSLPIYDDGPGTPLPGGPTPTVTIVGFLQVFINYVDVDGRLNVTVLNVAGCGNGSGVPPTGAPVHGSSPVPVRLITPP